MYYGIRDFVQTLGEGFITLCDYCDFLDFPSSCTGGFIEEEEDERRRLAASGSRRLSMNTDDCGDDCTLGSCDGTSNLAKAKKLKCKASKVEGLSFPFIAEPASNLELLNGGDVVSGAMHFKSLKFSRRRPHIFSAAAIRQSSNLTPRRLSFRGLMSYHLRVSTK